MNSLMSSCVSSPVKIPVKHIIAYILQSLQYSFLFNFLRRHTTIRHKGCTPESVVPRQAQHVREVVWLLFPHSTFLSANLKTTVYPGGFAGIYFREFLLVAKIIKIISQNFGCHAFSAWRAHVFWPNRENRSS